MKEFCDRVQLECQKTGRSLTQVMAKAHLGPSIFYKWREGRANPKPGSVKAIADALGMPAAELCPEMADLFETLGRELPRFETDAEDIGDEFVFIGMRRSALNVLRPLIDRANANLIEVPADCARSLTALMRNISSSYFSQTQVA